MTNKVNMELKKYIDENIVAKYKTFDKGHDERHVHTVIKRSFDIAAYNNLEVNYNMVYVVAAYHDYGNIIERKNHASHGAHLLIEDKNLEKWFTKDEIITMAMAVEDHSTSSKTLARNIYGKIVADADKDVSLSHEDSIKRALAFSLKHFSEYDENKHLEDCYNHLLLKFGENGTVKFYLPFPQNDLFLEEKRKLCNNKKLFLSIAKKVFCELTNNADMTK